MTVYVVLIVIFFMSFFFFRYRYDADRTKELMITTFFVVYMLLLCFRDTSVGVDVANYIKSYFQPFQFMGWHEVLQYKADELGFSILTKIIATITSNTQFYIIVVALISVIPVMILYRKESREAALCCSFFLISLLFEIFFSGLRQGIALGLTVPAYYFTKQKKLIPFILIVALAVTFHVSAVMIIFIYPIYHAKITGKWLWVVVPVMAIIYYFNRVIFSVLFETFGGKYFEKYSTLLGTTNQYGLLTLFALLAVYCVVMMDEESADNDDIGLRNILFLATTIQFFAPLHDIVSRMNYYFILFIPLAVTRANYKCKRRFWQIAKVASWVMTVYFIYYFFFSKGDTLHIMDYKFFF